MKLPHFLPRRLIQLLAFTACASFGSSHAAEQRVSSPNGTISVIVNDAGGLHYRVEIDGKPLVQESPLGMEFQGGVTLGPSAVIRKADITISDGTWEDRFGNRRVVPDRRASVSTLRSLALGHVLLRHGRRHVDGRRRAAFGLRHSGMG